jgi:hypothetical protein
MLNEMSKKLEDLQHTNIQLKLSNLYYRMKLAAEFMRSE